MDIDFISNYGSIYPSEQPLLAESHSNTTEAQSSTWYTWAVNKTVPILNKVVARTPGDTNKSWAITMLGRIQNHLGMWGQGIFGGLLIATMAKKIENRVASNTVAALGGIVVGYGAFKGKDLLVWFFGEENWRKLGERRCYEILSDILAFWRWRWDRDGEVKDYYFIEAGDHLFGILERLQTLIVSVGFAGLTRVSFSQKFGAGKLAQQLGSPTLSKFFDHYLLQLPFMISSANSNFLGLPNIHRYGAQDLFKIIKDFSNIFADKSNEDDTKIREIAQQFTLLVNSIRMEPTKNKDIFKKIRLEKELKDMMDNLHLSDAIYEYEDIIRYYDGLRETGQTKEPPGYFQKAFTWFVGAFSTAITCWGFQNFLSMPKVILNTFIENPENYEHITTPLGITWFLTMALMSCSVYQTYRNATSTFIFNDPEPQINYASKRKRYWNALSSFMLCLIGSTPNVFQELLSTNANSTTVLNLINVLTAVIGAGNLEGLTMLFQKNRHDETKACKKAKESNTRDDKLLLMARPVMTLFEKAKQHKSTEQAYDYDLIKEIQEKYLQYSQANREPTNQSPLLSV